jgi:hypothetical protein
MGVTKSAKSYERRSQFESSAAEPFTRPQAHAKNQSGGRMTIGIGFIQFH